MVTIRISEASYQRGLENCKTNLVGRVSLHRNQPPTKAHELASQLRSYWPQVTNWTVAPLGKGFFMLRFQSVEDMQRIWSLGSVNLRHGVIRFIKWTPSFSPSTYRNTFAQVWVRFWDLGFAYWDHQTLFEIAKGVGTPIKLDPRTQNRSVGLYARILVDVDLSRPLLTRLRVNRENGDTVVLGVDYESVPVICAACNNIGHNASTCNVRQPVVVPAENVPSSNPKVVDISGDLDRGRSAFRSQRTYRKASSSTRRSPRRAKIPQPAQVVEPRHQPAPAHSSSSLSVPPGFRRASLEPIATTSTTFLTGTALSVSPSVEINSAPIIPVLDADFSLVGDKEDGEFSPVVSKKTKKLSKLAEKSKRKPLTRKPSSVHALLHKGSKHKLYQ